MTRITAALAMIVVAGAVNLSGSDRTGVYGVIDKVVFEPSTDKPERVQLWGSFALASRNDNDTYDEVRRGYLYFTAADSKELARREWNDLKALAGTKRIAAFGSRFGQSVHVRAESEKPQAPDNYVLGVGVQAVRPDRNYPPIKALVAQIPR
jgi:hypothetical protein